MKGYKANIYQVYTKYILEKRTYTAPPLKVSFQENALMTGDEISGFLNMEDFSRKNWERVFFREKKVLFVSKIFGIIYISYLV